MINEIKTTQVVIILFFLNIVFTCLNNPTKKAEPISVTRIAKEKQIAKVAGSPFISLGIESHAMKSKTIPITTQKQNPVTFCLSVSDGHISPKFFFCFLEKKVSGIYNKI